MSPTSQQHKHKYELQNSFRIDVTLVDFLTRFTPLNRPRPPPFAHSSYLPNELLKKRDPLRQDESLKLGKKTPTFFNK